MQQGAAEGAWVPSPSGRGLGYHDGMAESRNVGDVRMRGFRRRSTVVEALGWLDEQLDRQPSRPRETVPLLEAAGRVLAGHVDSPRDIPHFDRAMMDGYAVRAADTQGAAAYNPLPLGVIGGSLPGQPFSGRVGPGQTVRIMTGAPMPDGADAVLPAEQVEQEDAGSPDTIHAIAAVGPGKHVGGRGEDVARGGRVLEAGRVLRPQDVGVLASIGLDRVEVLRRPQVRIVITGNELLPVGSELQPHHIIDSNGPMLDALVRRDGGVPVRAGITPDDLQAILEAMVGPTTADAAMAPPCEMVIISGGSSVGQEDHAPRLLDEHGVLAIHGIAMRPSSPTGLGTLPGDDRARLVFLLPGNPVSCLCAYDFFAGRAVRRLGGRTAQWPYHRSRVPLVRKVVSAVGRLDYLRVRRSGAGIEPVAIGGASVLSSTVHADGFVLIPPDSEGHAPGTEVDVFWYDAPS